MTLTEQLAKQARAVYSGGNWTGVNLKETLADLTWHEAVTKVGSLNTIAILVFHINYYVGVILKVMEGGPLTGSDKLSFNTPPISSAEDWQRLVDVCLSQAELLAQHVEQLKDERLLEDFSDGKYGNYYRNLSGVIEHVHYHLGQITLIKKLLRTHGQG